MMTGSAVVVVASSMIVEVVASVVGTVREVSRISVSVDRVSVDSVSVKEGMRIAEAESVAIDEWETSTVDDNMGLHGPATTA